jgi:hypothetical protein
MPKWARPRLGRARKGAARAAQLLWCPRCKFAQYRPAFRPERVAGVLLAVGNHCPLAEMQASATDVFEPQLRRKPT